MRFAHGLFSALFVLMLVTLAYGSPRFVEHVVNGSFAGAVSLHVIDMDSDLDLDIVACGVDGDYISWFEQQAGMQFIEHPVASGIVDVYSVTAADFDEDGLMDIASAAYTADRLDVWLQQIDGTFAELALDDNYNQAHTGEVADMNEDGHIDLLSMGGGNMPLRLYENDGSANFTMIPLHELTYRGQSCRPIDMDLDGDLDILSNNFNNSRFSLFRNDGEENFVAELIGFNDGSHWIIGADVDGDGFPNPVTASYIAGEISWWWLNFGIWNRTSIDDQLIGAVYIEAADFDIDGDMDLVATAEAGGQLAWYENDATEFTKHVLDNGFVLGGEVVPIDLDGDGDLDIVAASKGLNDIVWWELESIQPPSEFELITPLSGDTIRTDENLLVEWTASSDNDPGADVSYSVQLGCALQPEDTSWVVMENITGTNAQFMPPMLWPDVDPGEYDGIVYVYAGSQGDVVTCINPAEVSLIITANAVEDERGGLPAHYALLPSHPNPFNSTTTVTIALPEASDLTVTVFNTLGQEVAQLANGPTAAGTHAFTFDASDLSSGIYFVQANVPGKLDAMQKVALVR